MSDKVQGLYVTLFGCPKVFQPQSGAAVALGQKTSELLTLLLLRGRHAHRREKLAATLWSESPPQSAAHSLRTTLWRLRRVLEPPGVNKGTYLCVTGRDEVGFNWQSEHAVDVLEFQSVLNRYNSVNIDLIADTELQAIDAALKLYQGELLEGHFNDWITYERERLRDLYIQGLSYLMQIYMRRNDHQQVIACGRRALIEDPLRESVHRDLMRSYVEVGQRAEAIKLYEELSRTLDSELEVAPSTETTDVYLWILRLEHRTASTAAKPDRGREIVETMNQMQSSLDALDQERCRLIQMLNNLKTLLEPHYETSD